ncbi:MAG: hypothetical protein QM479_11410 [Pseudomonadota bacterium]
MLNKSGYFYQQYYVKLIRLFFQKIITILLLDKSLKVAKALFYRGLGVLLQLLLNIFIGQFFGTRGMGFYQIYTTWMLLLAELSSLGLPMYTMRKVSALRQKFQFTDIQSCVKKYLLLVCTSSVILLLPVMLFSSELSLLLLASSDKSIILIYAAIAALSFLGIRLLSEAVKAMGYTNFGILSESALIPLISLLSLFFIWSFALNVKPESILISHVFSLFCVFAIIYFSWNKILANKLKKTQKEVITNKTLTAILPKLISSHAKQITFNRSLGFIWCGMILNILFINLPVLLLPYYASTEEIGLFGVAFRMVMLSTSILVSLAALFGPRFVFAFKNKDVVSLKQELRHSQWYSLCAYAPFFIVFTVFPESLLAIFGSEFIQAKTILLILAAAQLVNSATGLVGYFLVMIHHEKAEFITLLIALFMVFPMMLVLGNFYGMLGIVIAYAIAIIIKNLLSLVLSLYFLNTMPIAGEQL